MGTSSLEKRVESLEATTGGDGGCDRCRGMLVVVSNAVTGEFHSARWNGEDISEEEASEHQAERRCPRCGSKLDPESSSVIRLRGRRS